MKRRTFLAGGLAAFLAGCSGGDGTTTGDPDPTADPDAGTDTRTRTPTAEPTTTATPTPTATATSTDDGLEKVDGGGDEKGTGTPPEGPKSKAPPDPIYDGTLSFPAGERRFVRFAPNDPVVLQYRFTTARLAIDAMLMTEDGYESIGVAAEPEYVEEASVLDSEGDSVRARLQPPAEGYVLVFDNTDLGEAGPGRNAAVDDAVEVTATVTLFDQ
jgi:hypothetical protein